VCFNKFCIKNPFSKFNFSRTIKIIDRDELSKFTDNRTILGYCTKVLLKTKDPEGLVCSDSISINEDNLDSMTDEQIIGCFDDIFQLGCSFIEKTNKTDKDPFKQCAVDQKLL
jgi:hypothetical protein